MSSKKIISSKETKNNGATVVLAGKLGIDDKTNDAGLGFVIGAGTSLPNRPVKSSMAILANHRGEFALNDSPGRFTFLRSNTKINAGERFSFAKIGQSIMPSGGEATHSNKSLGYSVSSSANSDGTILAYGAPRGDTTNDGGHENGGYARVHQYDGTTWKQIGGDILGSDYTGDATGWSVSLDDDGDTLIVGAKYDDGWMTPTSGPASGYNAGSASVYRYSGDSWSQLGAVIQPTQYNVAASGDEFGSAVSINGAGDRVVIGAPQLFSSYRGNELDTSNPGASGYAEVYTYSGSSWSQTGSRLRFSEPSIDDNFGGSVSINKAGDIIAVGCPSHMYQTADDEHLTGKEEHFNRGAVEVYQYSSSSSDWERMGGPIHGEQSNAQFGHDVSLTDDGLTLAVGGHRDYTRGWLTGKVSVFEYKESEWIKKGSDILGENLGDTFGYSVSISPTGKYLVVGATGWDDDGGGLSTGKTYVYIYDSGWVLLDSLKGETLSGEYFGYDVSSVKQNGDEITIIVGAPFSDSFGTTTNTNTGEVRSYKCDLSDYGKRSENNSFLQHGSSSSSPTCNNSLEQYRSLSDKVYYANGKPYTKVARGNSFGLNSNQGGWKIHYIDPQVAGGETNSSDSAASSNRENPGEFTYTENTASDKSPKNDDYKPKTG